MRKPKVGEKLWIVSKSGTRPGYRSGPGESFLITGSGPKYFRGGEPVYGGEITFYVETWKQKCCYSADFILYESEQHWLDEVEMHRYWAAFYNLFHYSSRNEYSIQQMKDVARVMNFDIEKIKCKNNGS